MSTNPNDKLLRLQTYADSLKQRLANPIPAKHAKTEGSRSAFKEMIELDLKKTLAQISKLKGV